MGTSDAAPDRAELRTPDFLLCLVDEAHTLAQIKVGGLLVLHALDLQDGGVLVLVAQSPLETHHHTLDVQPAQMTQHRWGNVAKDTDSGDADEVVSAQSRPGIGQLFSNPPCRQQASKGQPLRYDVITIALHSTCQLFYIIHSMRSPRGLLRLLARNAAHGD